MSNNISIEIQTEILKRVPVKSLFQFRSVSKSWKSLIDSSQFIADYNEYQSRPQRLFICYEDHIYPDVKHEFDFKYVIIVDDDIFPQHRFPTTFPVSNVNSFELNIEKLGQVCSSQGLLCFSSEYKYDGSIWDIALIWNPAIRKSIAIALPVFYGNHLTDLGFGVCPNTNEPVLVVITGCDFETDINIFRLSSRVWRKPLGNLPRKCIGFKESRLAIDGFIYWELFDMLILSFDMTSEEFTEINLPKSFASTTDWSISELRGSLAVVEYSDEKPFYDVWRMEDGVTKSFTKLFTITKPNGFLLGFRMNGDLILQVKKTYEEPVVVEVYEPHTEHIKDLGIYAKQGIIFLMSYKETLLLLDQVDYQHINHPNFISD